MYPGKHGKSIEASQKTLVMWDNEDAYHEHEAETAWWWENARREIISASIVRQLSNDANSILEIGAGYGSMSIMLAQFGRVTTVEPYAGAAQYLRDNLGLETFHGMLEDFESSAKFNIVTSFDSLEHIEDDQAALQKMTDLLAPGGLMIITVPALKFLWNRHDIINQHYRRYTRNMLKAILPAELQTLQMTYFNSLLFPLALADKVVLSRNKQSCAFKTRGFINTFLYRVMSAEKYWLKYGNFPFGVSILLLARKEGGISSSLD